MLHYPVFIPVRNENEFMLVKVNAETPEALPIFTSKELAELYTQQEGSGLNLFQIDDAENFLQFIRDFIRNHGIEEYAINFTFSATAVKQERLSQLMETTELDKPRSKQESKNLESIAGEDGFKPFGNEKYLFLCFVRGHAPNIEKEVHHAYTVGQARATINKYLAEGWRIYWRIWGDLYMKH